MHVTVELKVFDRQLRQTNASVSKEPAEEQLDKEIMVLMRKDDV